LGDSSKNAGIGVQGNSSGNAGVQGNDSGNGTGVVGTSTNGTGIFGKGPIAGAWSGEIFPPTNGGSTFLSRNIVANPLHVLDEHLLRRRLALYRARRLFQRVIFAG
jgi:hypothetical protein